MNLKFVAILVGITIPCFHAIFTEKENNNASFIVTPAEECSVKTIIFDLGDVLIAPSLTKQTTLLLSVALQHPSLWYTLATQNMKQRLFDMLNNIPAHTDPADQVMYNQGKQMPQIMVDWQTGRCNQDISAKILTYLTTCNLSSSEKILFSKIIQLIFQPQQLVQTLQFIQPMVKIIRALKKQDYRLYILSNWDAESFPLLIEKHTDFFNLFDGIMISGTEGIGKPNPEFYIKLLEKYDLNATECAFVDDEPYNITTACNLGVHGILHKSTHETCLQLKNLGILQQSPL